MNINAKQVMSIDTTRMDNTTVLGFFQQIKNIIEPQEAFVAVLSTVLTAYLYALAGFDQAFAQVRKWIQTADIEELDKQRDASLRGFLNALKAMLESPNAEKRQAAKYIDNIRMRYSLNPNEEYMKETTAISQMVQEMETDAQCDHALQACGLDEWLADLKTRNEAFLAKMNERTEAQAGQQKGIVREKRQETETKYKDLVKLINASAICEMGQSVDYNGIIDQLNAEIEHYKQILSRKGSSEEPEPTPEPDNNESEQ